MTVLCCSQSSPLHDRLVNELETVWSCVELVAAEMAALCCTLQQQRKPKVSMWSLPGFCCVCFEWAVTLFLETNWHAVMSEYVSYWEPDQGWPWDVEAQDQDLPFPKNLKSRWYWVLQPSRLRRDHYPLKKTSRPRVFRDVQNRFF